MHYVDLSRLIPGGKQCIGNGKYSFVLKKTFKFIQEFARMQEQGKQ